MGIEGVINILKPPGMTSSDVVSDVRKILKERRVGHTGTLDPGAAGVLPVCVGRATRLFDYLVNKRKRYLTEIRFGLATDTGDSDGRIIEQKPCSVSAQDVAAALPALLGEQLQRVPMYSAAKHEGKKLYELARVGKSIERQKQVNIYSIELVEQTGENAFLLDVKCSKGTYVRVLCEDIGRALGLPAYMSFLLRSESGDFSLDTAISIKQLEEFASLGELDGCVVPVDEAVAFLPEVRLDGALRHKLIQGATLPCKAQDAPACRVYAGGFVGIGTLNNNALHVNAVLCDVDDI